MLGSQICTTLKASLVRAVSRLSPGFRRAKSLALRRCDPLQLRRSVLRESRCEISIRYVGTVAAESSRYGAIEEEVVYSRDALQRIAAAEEVGVLASRLLQVSLHFVCFMRSPSFRRSCRACSCDLPKYTILAASQASLNPRTK